MSDIGFKDLLLNKEVLYLAVVILVLYELSRHLLDLLLQTLHVELHLLFTADVVATFRLQLP